ncbi:hypothetical protein Taro_005609, partial [Colocasia esculenta]|nr:hypothetical protein [Colocasia esculenta]
YPRFCVSQARCAQGVSRYGVYHRGVVLVGLHCSLALLCGCGAAVGPSVHDCKIERFGAIVLWVGAVVLWCLTSRAQVLVNLLNSQAVCGVDGSIDCRGLLVGGTGPCRRFRLASTGVVVCMGLAAASFAVNLGLLGLRNCLRF